MIKQIKVQEHMKAPSRYDYFLIQELHLTLLSTVLELISYEFEIVAVIKHSVTDKDKFERIINIQNYSDTKVKTDGRKWVFIFVKNNNVKSEIKERGPLRHIQSKTMHEIKTQLSTTLANYSDVFVSDYEIHTDIVLKYLGNPQGIAFLDAEPNFIMTKPYHLSRYTTFEIKEVELENVLCSINYIDEAGKTSQKISSIKESPHYRSLIEGKHVYEHYLNQFFGTLLIDNYSVDKFFIIKDNFKYLTDSYPLNYIIVEELDLGKFKVLDGLHRASILLYNRADKVKVSVVTYERN